MSALSQSIHRPLSTIGSGKSSCLSGPPSSPPAGAGTFALGCRSGRRTSVEPCKSTQQVDDGQPVTLGHGARRGEAAGELFNHLGRVVVGDHVSTMAAGCDAPIATVALARGNAIHISPTAITMDDPARTSMAVILSASGHTAGNGSGRNVDNRDLNDESSGYCSPRPQSSGESLAEHVRGGRVQALPVGHVPLGRGRRGVAEEALYPVDRGPGVEGHRGGGVAAVVGAEGMSDPGGARPRASTILRAW